MLSEEEKGRKTRCGGLSLSLSRARSSIIRLERGRGREKEGASKALKPARSSVYCKKESFQTEKEGAEPPDLNHPARVGEVAHGAVQGSDGQGCPWVGSGIRFRIEMGAVTVRGDQLLILSCVTLYPLLLIPADRTCRRAAGV